MVLSGTAVRELRLEDVTYPHTPSRRHRIDDVLWFLAAFGDMTLRNILSSFAVLLYIAIEPRVTE